jgi:ubiquinol-cytochrome c reductase cytochrome c subunit
MASSLRLRAPVGVMALGAITLLAYAEAANGLATSPVGLASPGAAAANGLPVGLASPGAAAAPPASLPAARDIYLRDCAACHAADGRGTVRGPNLVGVGRGFVDYELSTGRMPLLGLPAQDPRRTRVLRQLPGVQFNSFPVLPVQRAAPAYPPGVIAALVDFVGSFGVGGPDIPNVDLAGADLARGGQLFRLDCAACHEWAGGGGALLNRVAPALHNATPVQIAEAVRAGPGQMPAFGPAAISTGDLNSLVAYVRYLNHPRDPGGNGLWHLGPFAEGAIALILGVGVLLLVTGWIGERE